MASDLAPRHAPAALDRRAVLRLAAALPLAPLLRGAAARAEDVPGAGGPMEALAARYAALGSYSDTGTVETRYQWPGTPLIVERHRFETAFRGPRNFFFRFDADPASRDDAMVIWCDGGPFQSWWKATGVHTVHDNGQGAVAFYTAQSTTLDSANLVAPHLFPQAELYGPTSRLIDAVSGEPETVEGRRCATVRAAGRVTGVVTSDSRPTTLWIDEESGLVVKALTDTEPGGAPDAVDQRLYSIDPVADPDLGDERFVFAPPEGGQ